MNWGVNLSLLGLLALTACAAPAPTGVNDPYEGFNRKVHGFNVAVDKNVIRPLAQGTDKIIPDPVARGVTNFADNLALPGMVVNSVLQANIGDAAHNSLRFLVNTTVGLGGIFDLATPAGAPERETDFGETLHVWGMAEGAYTELPLLGPSTARDALGRVVDLALDPMRIVIPKDKALIGASAKAVALLDKRGRYSQTVDSVLYDSADGYAQARLLYLQNRRHDLGQTEPDSDFEDPYAE